MTNNKYGDKLTYCLKWGGIKFKAGRVYRLLSNLKAKGEQGDTSNLAVNDYRHQQYFRRLYKNELKLKIN